VLLPISQTWTDLKIFVQIHLKNWSFLQQNLPTLTTVATK
jgi:hypothetical protein